MNKKEKFIFYGRRSEKGFKNLSSTSFHITKYHFVCLENYNFILFKNIDRAKDFASIKTYIETCYRNGIDPHTALLRLSLGVPLTINEILEPEK